MRVIQVTTRLGGVLVGWLIAQSLTDHSGAIPLPYVDPNLLIGAIGMAVLFGLGDLRGMLDTVNVPVERETEATNAPGEIETGRRQSDSRVRLHLKIFGAMGLVCFGISGGYLAGAIGVWDVGPMVGGPGMTGAAAPVWILLFSLVALGMAAFGFGLSYYASLGQGALKAGEIE